MSTRDFRATQVRTHAIIGSGSSPQLLLYPSASATNQYGGVDLQGTGSDAWMFVSGAIGTSSGKVVFGGDVIISGSVTGIGGVIGGGGGGGDSYFSSTTAGSIFTTGSAAFRGEESSVDSPSDKGSDVFFYVSGTVGGVAASSRRALFGGDVVASGSIKASGITGSNLSVTGDTTIGGNLTVNGTTTTVNTTNLLVKDPIILIGSGSTSSNANGGIALASGSATANKSLVFGRIANDTWGVGKLDVLNGATSSLAGMDLVGIRAGKFEVANSGYVTGGLGNIELGSAGGAVILRAGAGVYNFANEVIEHQFSGSYTIFNTLDADPTKYLLKITDPSDTFQPKVEIGNADLGSAQLYVNGNHFVSGFVTASLGFSGSHTNLTDGRSFLVAGTNVTITSASDGQITIASSGGGGGTPAGPVSSIQFNNAGSFGGDSGLTYDQSTDTLKATVVTASLGFSGSHTALSDGSAFIRAGTSNSMAQTGSISVTSASNGAVTVNAYVFPNDITISLSGGRTFGRYASGETIPATGKTPAEVILLATAEPIAPTVPAPTATNPITSTWNTTGSITTSVTASYTINSLGASVAAATLQFRSGSVGDWSTLLTSTTNPLKYDHTFTVGTNFTTVLNYQYIVQDSAGAAATGTVNLTPQSYTAPTIGTLTMARSTINGITGESNTTRERGNVFSEITGTITRNRTNAQLSSYTVQFSVNGGAYSNVTGFSGSITGNPAAFTFSGSHNDPALKTSVTSSLAYRVSVVDTWTTSSVTPGSSTITFLSAIFYGTASAAPTTSANVRSLGNKVFTTTGDPFNLLTGITDRFFVVALPTRETSHDTISSVIDTSALNANITTSYVNSPFGVDDGGGVSSTYNVYTMEIATPYSPTEHTHSVDRA